MDTELEKGFCLKDVELLIQTSENAAEVIVTTVRNQSIQYKGILLRQDYRIVACKKICTKMLIFILIKLQLYKN